MYEDIIKRYEEYEKEAMLNAINDFFLQEFSPKAREMFNSVVDTFYNGFNNGKSPKVYKRKGNPASQTGGLYDVLQISFDKSKKQLNVFFDETKLSFRNGYSGEDGLYTQVFRLGWHGGAAKGDYTLHKTSSGAIKTKTPHPSVGVPYYRNASTHFLSWGRKAEIAKIPPLIDFTQRLNYYVETEGKLWIQDRFDEYMRNFKIVI